MIKNILAEFFNPKTLTFRRRESVHHKKIPDKELVIAT
jgi:hypothetical protein